MRFVDEAIITVRSGKGGSGCVSFRREKFVPRGGPDGGDGGDGGSVIARASDRLHSLYDFRLKRLYQAENGQQGQGSQCHGRNGKDLILELPVGTQIYMLETGKRGELVADLSEVGCEAAIAVGGRGGRGNEFFKSSTMRAPRFAQPGEDGEERTLGLELKILADCGLLGLPNAGKSTFISKVSAARPKIAPYPFTTLEPNLGVMLDEENPSRRMIIADIPGLVEGAHTGFGLGHRFLKHVERTRFLVHILSIEDIPEDIEQGDPWAGFALINNELAMFAPELADRQQLKVINKTDLATPMRLEQIKQRAMTDGMEIFFISALNGIEIEPLMECMWKLQANLLASAPVEGFIKERLATENNLEGVDAKDTAINDDSDAEDYEIEVIYRH